MGFKIIIQAPVYQTGNFEFIGRIIYASVYRKGYSNNSKTAK